MLNKYLLNKRKAKSFIPPANYEDICHSYSFHLEPSSYIASSDQATVAHFVILSTLYTVGSWRVRSSLNSPLFLSCHSLSHHSVLLSAVYLTFKFCSINIVINRYVNFHLPPPPGTGFSLKSLIKQPYTMSLQLPLCTINTRGFPERLRDARKCFSSLNCGVFECVHCLQVLIKHFRHCLTRASAPLSEATAAS